MGAIVHRGALGCPDAWRRGGASAWTGWSIGAVRTARGVALSRDVSPRTEEASGDRQETARVVAWRYARLHQAGFDTELAEEFARESDVDLHALIELVQRGCPPPLAARILAPLDYRDRVG